MGSTTIGIIVLALIIGLIAYVFAKDNGKKKPNNWFLAGFLTSLAVLFTISAIRKKK